jgi:hypothetical protein
MKKSTSIIAVLLITMLIITLASLHWLVGLLAFLLLGLPVLQGFKSEIGTIKPDVNSTRRNVAKINNTKTNAFNSTAVLFGILLVLGIILVLSVWSNTNGVLAFLTAVPLLPLLTGFIEAVTTGQVQPRRRVTYVDEGDYSPESTMSRSLKKAGKTAAYTAGGFVVGYKAAKKTEL